jgi:hypothetical protein
MGQLVCRYGLEYVAEYDAKVFMFTHAKTGAEVMVGRTKS